MRGRAGVDIVKNVIPAAPGFTCQPAAFSCISASAGMTTGGDSHYFVIPAKAGIQWFLLYIPA